MYKYVRVRQGYNNNKENIQRKPHILLFAKKAWAYVYFGEHLLLWLGIFLGTSCVEFVKSLPPIFYNFLFYDGSKIWVIFLEYLT
jgi:hypothetical protein